MLSVHILCVKISHVNLSHFHVAISYCIQCVKAFRLTYAHKQSYSLTQTMIFSHIIIFLPTLLYFYTCMPKHMPLHYHTHIISHDHAQYPTPTGNNTDKHFHSLPLIVIHTCTPTHTNMIFLSYIIKSLTLTPMYYSYLFK